VVQENTIIHGVFSVIVAIQHARLAKDRQARPAPLVNQDILMMDPLVFFVIPPAINAQDQPIINAQIAPQISSFIGITLAEALAMLLTSKSPREYINNVHYRVILQSFIIKINLVKLIVIGLLLNLLTALSITATLLVQAQSFLCPMGAVQILVMIR